MENDLQNRALSRRLIFPSVILLLLLLFTLTSCKKDEVPIIYRDVFFKGSFEQINMTFYNADTLNTQVITTEKVRFGMSMNVAQGDIITYQIRTLINPSGYIYAISNNDTIWRCETFEKNTTKTGTFVIP